MAYKPKVKTVSEGGTGAVTLTGVLTGNGTGTVTASTVTNRGIVVAGASNSVSTVAPGTSGNVLTSNGTSWTSATPAAASGYILNMRNTGTGNPADATTYFMTQDFFAGITASGPGSRIIIPKTGTITTCYGVVTVSGTLASAGSSTLSIRLNDTTDTAVTSSLSLTLVANTISNTGLSIAVTAGNFIEFKLLTPTWATNPTTVSFLGYVVIT